MLYAPEESNAMRRREPMSHERALRSLSIQHHLHIGATAPRSGYDDRSDRRPDAPRPGVQPASAFRTLFRRRR